MEGRFIGGFEEGQLLLLGEGRQDAADMPQEGTRAIDTSTASAQRPCSAWRAARLFRLSAMVGWSAELRLVDLQGVGDGSAAAYRPIVWDRNARLFRLGGGGVVGELRLVDLQGASVERLGIRVTAHRLVEQRQVVQAERCRGGWRRASPR